jgi:hypothetical protein
VRLADIGGSDHVVASVPVALGAHYVQQRSVDDPQNGGFSNLSADIQANFARGPFGAPLSFTRTATRFATQYPWSDQPSYLDQQEAPFTHNLAQGEPWHSAVSEDCAAAVSSPWLLCTDRGHRYAGASLP